MPRKGENIFKRKDGRWEGRYIKAHTPQGKALYGYVYARTYKDVKQKLCVAINTLPLKVWELKTLDIAGFFISYFSTLLVFFLRTLPAVLCKLFERTSHSISFDCPS